jgi:uncharacterized membrane protein
MRADVAAAILAMGAATFLCRAGGYFLMRYVAITPAVEAWLKAIPVALFGAILGPAAVNGGLPEWIGLAAVLAVMRVTGNDFAAAVVGVTTVAALRALH